MPSMGLGWMPCWPHHLSHLEGEERALERALERATLCAQAGCYELVTCVMHNGQTNYITPRAC